MAPDWTWSRFGGLGVDNLYDALALRCRVFVLEQGPYLDPDGLDRQAWHLLGRDAQGALQAYLRVVDPGVKYAEPSIGRVITSPEARGTGLGRAIAAAVVDCGARVVVAGRRAEPLEETAAALGPAAFARTWPKGAEAYPHLAAGATIQRYAGTEGIPLPRAVVPAPPSRAVQPPKGRAPKAGKDAATGERKAGRASGKRAGRDAAPARQPSKPAKAKPRRDRR
jgi:predicted GNAT family N-acyltransferase